MSDPDRLVDRTRGAQAGQLLPHTREKGAFVDEEVHGLLRSEWIERAR